MNDTIGGCGDEAPPEEDMGGERGAEVGSIGAWGAEVGVEGGDGVREEEL